MVKWLIIINFIKIKAESNMTSEPHLYVIFHNDRIHKTYPSTIKYHITFASLAISILGNNDFSLSSQIITKLINKYIIIVVTVDKHFYCIAQVSTTSMAK